MGGPGDRPGLSLKSFFEQRRAWTAFEPLGVVGVVSDFAGDNEYMGGELLNLVARTNQQYRVLLKNKLSPASFAAAPPLKPKRQP